MTGEYTTCGSLAALCGGWPADRPVWIQSRGGALERVIWADQTERGGDGAYALVLRSFLWDDPAAAEPPMLFHLAWSLHPGAAPLPASTVHRTAEGARARIRGVAAERGWVLGDEQTRPGGAVLGRVSSAGFWALTPMRTEN